MVSSTDSQHPDPQHTAFDIGAIILIVGSFVGYLPYIAAGLAGVWYCVLLYDRFFNKKRSGGGDP